MKLYTDDIILYIESLRNTLKMIKTNKSSSKFQDTRYKNQLEVCTCNDQYKK